MIRMLVLIGSAGTIAFGAWHFFVPKAWDWYSYIDPKATELVLAVQAINVFFSLCLVLIGLANILILYGSPDRFARIVMLSLSAILWGVRCAMQIARPQGAVSPLLQYGMLAAFVVVFACFSIALALTAF